MQMKNRIAHIREIYHPFYWAFVGLGLIIVSIQILGMVSPLLYSKIIDGFIKVQPVNQLRKLAFISLAVFMARDLLFMLHARIHIGKIALDVENRISEVTLTKVMQFSIGQIVNQNSGFKQDIIKKGESAIMEMIETLVFEIVPMFLRILVAMVGLFFLSVYLGLITLATVSAFIASSYVINNRLIPKLRKQMKTSNKLGSSYSEILRHLRLVIMNNQEERTVKEYCGECEKFNTENKKLWLNYFWRISVFRDPVNAVGQFFILIVSMHLVSSGKITPGKLVIAMAWSMYVFQSLGNAGSLQRKLARYIAAIGRYFDLLEIPPAVTMVENPIRPDKFTGRIEFRNVSFRYPQFVGRKDELNEEEKPKLEESNQAIEDISFTIEPGTTCAMVGHSGAGKSTVINLLMRGYDPNLGKILIDGNDLRLIHIGHWRKSVGYVEQDPKLWDRTVRYNMTYGLNGCTGNITDNELDELAQKTRISEFYERLGEKRFETEIGENGVQLSGGQRQRVAIARAIVKSPSLIILDEATNALDPVNEQLIHQAMREALIGRTGIIIAHRLSTIRHADQIIVFEKGRIVGNGKHEELMKTCPAYQALVLREVGTLSV